MVLCMTSRNGSANTLAGQAESSGCVEQMARLHSKVNTEVRLTQNPPLSDFSSEASTIRER